METVVKEKKEDKGIFKKKKDIEKLSLKFLEKILWAYSSKRSKYLDDTRSLIMKSISSENIFNLTCELFLIKNLILSNEHKDFMKDNEKVLLVNLKGLYNQEDSIPKLKTENI